MVAQPVARQVNGNDPHAGGCQCRRNQVKRRRVVQPAMERQYRHTIFRAPTPSGDS